MKLTRQQSALLDRARQSSQHSDYGVLVSGPTYRTAAALDRKGLGTLRYQGPGDRGWFTAK